MATLHEYYLKDFSRLLSKGKEYILKDDAGFELKIIAKVHLDFDSNALFISFYIPAVVDELGVFASLLNQHESVLKMVENIDIKTKLPGENLSSSEDLKFSGKIFFYYEGVVDENKFIEMQQKAKQDGLILHYRDINFSLERNKTEKPMAFISHDGRDKAIASKIANMLQNRMCAVWYDEYSLKLGDSLRESIEKGLKECHKCILILSPNFLKNLGWTKVEFNSIFTREIIETKNLVLHVWAGATKEDIYEYCPALVDRVGVNWDKGEDFVVSKIQQAMLAEN